VKSKSELKKEKKEQKHKVQESLESNPNERNPEHEEEPSEEERSATFQSFVILALSLNGIQILSPVTNVSLMIMMIIHLRNRIQFTKKF
jgi:hypothetical protein